MTFSGRFILNLIQFAGMQGVDIERLIKLTGYTEEELGHEEIRLNSEVYNAIMEEIVFLTKDKYFGIHSGEQMNLAAAGLIAQITQTSRTVLEAMKYCCEFAMLGCRAIPLELVDMGEFYKLAFVADSHWVKQSPLATRQTIEGMLAFTIREFNALTVGKSYPSKIHFDFDQPTDLSEYLRLFKCPMLFNQPETALYFDTENINQTIITADYNLLRILVEHAYKKLASLKTDEAYHQRVRQCALNLMNPQFPTIEQVAANLNTSVRSLQRKLSEENHTYKKIVDQLRKDFAVSYLKNPELQINDVAYLLSYSDASSFIRNFKKWMNCTPSQYRLQLI